MSSVATGNQLEEAIFSLLRAEVDAGRFFAKKSCCKLFRRKGYYSQDRKANIVFDVSIEVSLPGSTEYSLLVLVECKNYGHPVPVDDAEEFFAKVEQVGAANTKAILASTAAFQAGARAFAKSKGMGLLRYFDAKDFKWELRRSPSATSRGIAQSAEALVDEGLSGPAFRSEVFDLFLQTPARVTNSLWDLFDDLVAESALTPAQLRELSNRRDRLSNAVPFKEKSELEALADEALDMVSYEGGAVSLEEICKREASQSGLSVELQVPYLGPASQSAPLGCIQFEPLLIQVFASSEQSTGRTRFTLAHELAHHFLDHGKYMKREYCDEGDLVLNRQRVDDGTDIARMEYQANHFAACLLMPRRSFVKDFWNLLQSLDIRPKGFGPLYLDNQSCNLGSYMTVSGALMNRYKVSRSSVTLRLQGLGLLRDERHPEGPIPLQSAFLSAVDDFPG